MIGLLRARDRLSWRRFVRPMLPSPVCLFSDERPLIPRYCRGKIQFFFAGHDYFFTVPLIQRFPCYTFSLSFRPLFVPWRVHHGVSPPFLSRLLFSSRNNFSLFVWAVAIPSSFFLFSSQGKEPARPSIFPCVRYHFFSSIFVISPLFDREKCSFFPPFSCSVAESRSSAAVKKLVVLGDRRERAFFSFLTTSLLSRSSSPSPPLCRSVAPLAHLGPAYLRTRRGQSTKPALR